MTTHTLSLPYFPVLRAVTKTFFALALLLLVAYFYLLGASAFAVADSRALEREMGSLQSDIASLEDDYYHMASQLDIEYAYALGFENADTVYFVEVTPHTNVAVSRD